jgi:hypothetical protein
VTKSVIDPRSGHRWVDSPREERVWARRIAHHGGSSSMAIPVEIRRELDWNHGDILILRMVGQNMVVTKAPIHNPLSYGWTK